MNWKFRKAQEQKGLLEKAFVSFPKFEQKSSYVARSEMTHSALEKLLPALPHRKMGIHQLPEEVIAKLRSGIAITDVVHCIEELVSNSIDAGATCIAIRINLPFYKIQVIDNGEGISLDQMELIGVRYATSKCSSIKDLQSIKSGGFRGEALASLKDISSLLVVESRHKSSKDTYSKIFTQGKAKRTHCVADRASTGTTVTVHNFLYNMPVRRKCISEALDLEECRRSLEKIALVHPHISFSLRNDSTGEICMETKKCNSIQTSFMYLFGREKAQNLKKICFAEDSYEILGYASLDGHISKDLQLLYVNKRFISRCKLHKLVNKMFAKVLFTRQKRNSKNESSMVEFNIDNPLKSQVLYGIFVLNITCPYDQFDITFQPRKTAVVFSNEEKVTELIEKAVFDFFKCNNLLSESNSDSVHCTHTIMANLAHNKSEFPLDAGNDINVINMSKALLSLPAKRLPEGEKKEIQCSSPKKLCFEEELPGSSKKTVETQGSFNEISPKQTVTKYDQENSISSLCQNHVSKVESIATENKNLDFKKNTTKTSCLKKRASEQLTLCSNYEQDAPNRTVFPNSNPVMVLANVKYPCDDLPMSSNVKMSFDYLKRFQCQTLRHKISCKDSDTSFLSKDPSKHIDNSIVSHQAGTSQVLKKKQVSRFCFGDTPHLKQLKNIKFQKKSNNYSAVGSKPFISHGEAQDIKKCTRQVSHSNHEVETQYLINRKYGNKTGFNSFNEEEMRYGGEVSKEKGLIEKHVPSTYAVNNLKENATIVEHSKKALGTKTFSFQKRCHLDLFPMEKSLVSNETEDFAAANKLGCHSRLRDFQQVSKSSEKCNVLSRYANINVNDKDCQTKSDSQLELSMKHVSNIDYGQVSLTSNVTVKNKHFVPFGCFDNSLKLLDGTKALIINETPCTTPENTLFDSITHDVKQGYCHQLPTSEHAESIDSKPSKNMLATYEKNVFTFNEHQSHSGFEKQCLSKDKLEDMNSNSIYNSSDFPLLTQHEKKPLPVSLSPNRKIITLHSDLPPVFRRMLEKKCDAENELYHFASENCGNHIRSSGDLKKDKILGASTISVMPQHEVSNADKRDCSISILAENPDDISISSDKIVQVSSSSASDLVSVAKFVIDDVYRSTTENAGGCKSELNSNINLNYESNSHLNIIEDSPTIYKENEKSEKVQDSVVSDRKLVVKTLKGVTLAAASDNLQLNSVENSSKHCVTFSDKKTLGSTSEKNSKFIYETDKNEKLSISCEEIHNCDYKIENGQKTWSKDANLSSVHEELLSERSNSSIDHSHAVKGAVNFALEHCSNSKSLREEIPSSLNFNNDSFVEKNEKTVESISERWQSKTDPLTQRTVFINKISGNSTFAVPTTPADDLHRRTGDLSETKLCTSHFFLTHNASPFAMRPVSLRKEAKNDKAVDRTIVDSGLKDHMEEQENLSLYSKWNGPVPDMSENVIENMFSTWQNPMFKNAPSEMDLTCNPGSSKNQKIMFSTLNMHCFSKKAFSSLKVIGQVDNKFIACIVQDINENCIGKKLLVLFDQHAVHERIRLEKILEDLYETDTSGARHVKSSVISPPLYIKVKPNEARLLQTYHSHLLHFGITLVLQDENIFEVHSVPTCLVERVNSQVKRKRDADISNIVETLVCEWLTQLEQTRSVSMMLPKTLIGVLNSQACHGAVKFGDPLEKDECISLLGALSQCNLPFQCAHGRPSLAPILDIQKILFSKEASKPQLWKLTANRSEVAR